MSLQVVTWETKKDIDKTCDYCASIEATVCWSILGCKRLQHDKQL